MFKTINNKPLLDLPPINKLEVIKNSNDLDYTAIILYLDSLKKNIKSNENINANRGTQVFDLILSDKTTIHTMVSQVFEPNPNLTEPAHISKTYLIMWSEGSTHVIKIDDVGYIWSYPDLRDEITGTYNKSTKLIELNNIPYNIVPNAMLYTSVVDKVLPEQEWAYQYTEDNLKEINTIVRLFLEYVEN